MKKLLSGIAARLAGLALLIDWTNVLHNPKNIVGVLLVAIGSAIKAAGDSATAKEAAAP